MKNLMEKFLHDESGATMVEYGIMIALVAAVCIAAVLLLGQYVHGSFNGVNTGLSGNVTPAS